MRAGLWTLGGLAMAGVLWGRYQFVAPAPPEAMTRAADKQDGAHFAFAEALADQFAAEGIILKVFETEGSIDNLSLIAEGKHRRLRPTLPLLFKPDFARRRGGFRSEHSLGRDLTHRRCGNARCA